MRVDAFKASVGAFKEILFSRDCVCVKDAMAAALLSLSLSPPSRRRRRRRPPRDDLMHQSR